MKRFVKAETLVDEFLRYHDDEKNYYANAEGFDQMYSILEKYDESNGNDPVYVAFLKATPEDQQRMVDLIRPVNKDRSRGAAMKEFSGLLKKYFTRPNSYADGFMDAVDLLVELEYIDLDDFM